MHPRVVNAEDLAHTYLSLGDAPLALGRKLAGQRTLHRLS